MKTMAPWQHLGSTHFAYTVARTGRKVIATHPKTFYEENGTVYGVCDLSKPDSATGAPYRWNVLVNIAELRDICSDQPVA